MADTRPAARCPYAPGSVAAYFWWKGAKQLQADDPAADTIRAHIAAVLDAEQAKWVPPERGPDWKPSEDGFEYFALVVLDNLRAAFGLKEGS